MKPIPLRQSSPAEQPLQASKWLQSQALLSRQELASLFQFLEQSLAPFSLYACGVVCQQGAGEVSQQEFLDSYDSYIKQLMQGQPPDLSLYRSLFSPAMTVTSDALFAIPVGEDRQLIRAAKPVVQLQANNIHYSTIDKKFHSMIFGIDSIAWGLQFAYPQLYQDPHTKQAEIVKKSAAFPNTALFQLLQKWMRQHTIPTPFIAEGILTNVPMRLGKECLSWINQHPHLIQKNIRVKADG